MASYLDACALALSIASRTSYSI